MPDKIKVYYKDPELNHSQPPKGYFGGVPRVVGNAGVAATTPKYNILPQGPKAIGSYLPPKTMALEEQQLIQAEEGARIAEQERLWREAKAEGDYQERLALRKAYQDRVNTPGYSSLTGLPGESFKEMVANEAAPMATWGRVSDRNNVFDDVINPLPHFAKMASNLGSAPLRAQQEDSYMPYVSAVAEPLAAGLLSTLFASAKAPTNQVGKPVQAGLLNIPRTLTRFSPSKSGVAREVLEKEGGITGGIYAAKRMLGGKEFKPVPWYNPSRYSGNYMVTPPKPPMYLRRPESNIVFPQPLYSNLRPVPGRMYRRNFLSNKYSPVDPAIANSPFKRSLLDMGRNATETAVGLLPYYGLGALGYQGVKEYKGERSIYTKEALPVTAQPVQEIDSTGQAQLDAYRKSLE